MRELFSNSLVVPTGGAVGSGQDPGIDNVTREIVRRYDALVVWRPSGRGHAEARKIPDAGERAQLESRAAFLRRNVVPARESEKDRRRMGAAIAALFAGYPSQRNTNPQDIVAVYVSQLQDLPVWAVERACRSVIRGHAEGVSLDFAPSVARLYQLAKGEIGIAQAEAHTIMAALSLVLAEVPRQSIERQKLRPTSIDPTEGVAPPAEATARTDVPPDVTRTAEYSANESFIRECKRAGQDPTKGVSLSLLRTIQRMNKG